MVRMRTGLQVLHRVERRVVQVLRRPADTIGDDADVVVTLVCVGERVVHADVGQAADQDQRRRPQPAQHDLEIRSDETRVAPLDDVELVRPAAAATARGRCPAGPRRSARPRCRRVHGRSPPRWAGAPPGRTPRVHRPQRAAATSCSARSTRSAWPGMWGIPTSSTGIAPPCWMSTTTSTGLPTMSGCVGT